MSTIFIRLEATTKTHATMQEFVRQMQKLAQAKKKTNPIAEPSKVSVHQL